MKMALMAKIQTLDADGQRQILSLYSEDNPDYKFPIELRNIFADVIENAVCRGNLSSVDGGLDPANPLHHDSIISFLGSLVTLLEERLGNNQSGDQFFVKHKLSEALANFQEKKQSDPRGLFEHIRNKLKTEIQLVTQQEAALNSMNVHEKDVIMENIRYMKTQIDVTANILKDIRSNEENFQLNCNEKQRLEAIQSSPEQLQALLQQHPNGAGESMVRDSLASIERFIQQNICNLQTLLQRFEQAMQTNLQHIALLEGQIINEKLAIWKHEQQQMANRIVDANGLPLRSHSVSLEKLQIWCEELAVLIWNSYEQLKEAERILQNGLIETGNASHMTFVQGRTEDVLLLLQRLLKQSLIVEEQPPQIIKMKTKFPKNVVVSLLVGRKLNIHIKQTVSTFIISEDQVQTLDISEKIDTIGEITNGVQPMERKDKERLSATFKNMQLKQIKRTDRRGSGSGGSERVMEEKACLYFVCEAIIGPLLFKLSTISLPVVVISHGSQEALAVATITWDNAFGEIGRQPFNVPKTAPWAEVALILNAKFHEVAGRGLTEDNLACLAQKAFRNKKPQPETISWAELCKENLPNRSFTFWTWFHAALKLIEKKETHLKDLWKEGLIHGFIERETAEKLISRLETGTFLLRFADSIAGAITIVLLVKPDTAVSCRPYQMLELQTKSLSRCIKEIEEVKYLYRPTGLVHKDDVFAKFLEKEEPSNPAGTSGSTNPYVNPIQTIPDGDRSNGSCTPVRSPGNFQNLSPIRLEPSHSPSPFFPQSPPTSSFHEMQHFQNSNPNSIGMDTSGFETSSSTPTSFRSFLDPTNDRITMISPAGSISLDEPLVTPRPIVDQNQVFQFSSAQSEMFDDLIKVIRSDDDSMEIQL